VLSANPAFHRHFKVEPSATLGQKIYDLGNRQWDIPALRTLLEDVLPTNNAFDEFEMEHTFESIGTRTMLVNARRLDHVQLILLGLRDITERKLLEKEATAAYQGLERANDDLQHFSYAVSHDMQESLRMVVSFTEMLAREYPTGLNEKANKCIEYVVLGASRMESLLDDLKKYWSVSKQTVHKLESIDSNAALNRALAYLEPLITESGAEITHENLPKILGEQYPLTLLFQNLIANALKYREPQRVPEVHISARREDSAWVFWVADNGIGIDPQYFETIFVPFKRLQKAKYPGTGLGLAMCRRIVERYQGEIAVESSNAKGTTFRFKFSDTKAEAHEAPVERSDKR
jgi:light-regulated signal transduction histidine kinase (bacteriophytochrome)